MGNAPDGKMYIGNSNGIRKYMSYIDSPNVKGLGCGFVSQGVWQPYTNLMSPPNMPNYGLGKDTSVVCWPLASSEIRDVRDEMEVYPNPASSEINIDYNFDKNEIADLVIYDMLGREYIKAKLYGNVSHAKINTAQLMTGMYLYKISKKDKSNYTGKLIIE